MSKKILIIEDEPDIQELLRAYLEDAGYQTTVAGDGVAALERFGAQPFDLVLLDLGLPGKDGFALCAALRRESPVPIIIVTSRDSALDELKALSLGGDDYITKPYNIPILLARIKAVLRRTGEGGEADTLTAGPLTLHLTRGTAALGGQTVELTRNELKILACLLAHPGQIVPRADLIEALWDSEIYIDDNTLSVNVTRLRAKLGQLGLGEAIKTRRGMGYQYDGTGLSR